MKKWLLPACIGVHLLYINSVSFFPYPELFIYPYLASHGFLPYSQIFDQHFPTLLMLPINLWSLGFTGEWQMRLLMSVVVATTHVLIYVISKRLFEKKSMMVFVPNLLYFAFQPLYDGTYLWIDTILAPITLLVIYFITAKKVTLRNFLLAGLFLGIGLVIKQTIALFAVGTTVILFTNKQSRKFIIPFIFSAFIPLGIILFWIYKINVWQEFLFWSLEFNYTIYPKLANQMPSLSQLLRFLILWGLTGYLYGQAKKKTFEHHILGISALSLTVPAFGRFEFLHLQTALPFVILLFSFVFFNNKFKMPEFLLRKRIDTGAVVFISILLLVFWHVVWFNQMRYGGSYLSSGDTPVIAQEIRERTEDGEEVFILGGNPVLHPLSNTIPAGKVYTVSVPWNYVVAQSRIVQGLEESKPRLVVVDTNTFIDGQSEEDFAKEVLEFIENNYEKKDEVNGYWFYQKR